MMILLPLMIVRVLVTVSRGASVAHFLGKRNVVPLGHARVVPSAKDPNICKPGS